MHPSRKFRTSSRRGELIIYISLLGPLCYSYDISYHLQVSTETLTRAQHSDHTQCTEGVTQSANEDYQHHPSQSAMVSLCPVPVSESMTGPGAGLLGF